MLHLRSPGAFKVRMDDAPVERARSEKARALLPYLAVESDCPHRRTTLAALLGPDYSDTSALRLVCGKMQRRGRVLRPSPRIV